MATQLRVLLIEDSVADKKMLCRELETVIDVRCEVEHCDRLSQGFGVLDNNGIDAVILDPGLSDNLGLDGVTDIRRRSEKVAIIVLSGAGQIGNVITASRMGADAYWLKPVKDVRQFAWSLVAAVERRRQMAAQAEKPAWWKDSKTVALITAIAALLAALARLIWGK